MLNIWDIEEKVTITPETVEITLRRMGELEDRVSEVFSDYCKVFKKYYGYGVDKFEIRDTLYIRADISRRGCSDYESFNLDLRYLYLESDERITLMESHKKEVDKKDTKKQREENLQELARAEARVAALKQKL